ncbi:unnamed protein product [Brachionus calyciflorus]|uniref:Uncharacterized protein n=1 Tax=Brachionus calyciflorus TaxID=104777 RepID=A0A813NID0_9BILA|nr:unnamed protein product [Brachionus calyciflorus]
MSDNSSDDGYNPHKSSISKIFEGINPNKRKLEISYNKQGKFRRDQIIPTIERTNSKALSIPGIFELSRQILEENKKIIDQNHKLVTQNQQVLKQNDRVLEFIDQIINQHRKRIEDSKFD